ncbi:MAG: hypothetical protein H7338_04090, partial [Candidatus Sericytochromatia bacterium]|nr:hypothetical protein [Candidatus Sericytochromatia bacterium]
MVTISSVRPTASLQAYTPAAAPAVRTQTVTMASDELQLGSVSRMTMGAMPSSDLSRLAINVGTSGYTGIMYATGHSARLAGGATPWLSRGFAAFSAVTGVIDLNSELRSTTKRPTWARGLVLAGGYLATTGSVIGVLGGILPGVCIAAVGSVIQAVG